MIKLVWLPLLSGVAALVRWRSLLQGGDLLGISRTIDQAVYTLFNSAAVVLWRFNSALISMSLFSYNTQDWLTNRSDGGVWQVMDIVTGPGGLLGLNAWHVLMVLAMMMFGMSLLLRPFVPFHPVDVGKAFIYGVLSLTVIQQGSALMTGIETWRSDLGGYMYQTMADRGSVNIEVPGVTPTGSDPMHAPGDLDGRAPIRGWEAVSTSYFLVTNEAELNNNIPPQDFRVAYCLYDPNQPVTDQAEENSEGCSPRKAWDEWDYLGSTGVVTSVWGIELPISLGYELPIQADHPENRELGLRQAQSGVARLALGPVVALYPLLEANVSLMLALSASILYLTVPIMLLFGFFRFTEPLVTRLLLRFIHIIVNTIILNGLVALFLLLLINVSVGGSLSAYLGIVGVAVLGGYMLTRVAAGTLKETLSTAMSGIGGVWMTATTGAMGREVAPAARTALGAAKLVGAGALVGAAGMKMVDLAEGAYHGARSGLRDLDQSGWGATARLQKQAGQLPAPLARMAQEGLTNDDLAIADPMLMADSVQLTRSLPGAAGAARSGQLSNGSWSADAAVLGIGTGLVGHRPANGSQNGSESILPSQTNGATPANQPAATVADRYSQSERQAVWDTARDVGQQPQYVAPDGSLNSAGLQVVADRLTVQGIRAFQSDPGQHDLGLLLAAQQNSPSARGWGAPEARQPQLDTWIKDAWQSQRTGRGEAQVQTRAQALFGEQLAADVGRAVSRREQGDIEQIIAATRRAAAEMPPAEMSSAGQVTPAGLAAIKAQLPPDAASSFQGRRDEQDLAALAGATLQRELTASPPAFREALATAGARQAGRDVPEQLGLDPVAAGPHFSALNRFAQVSQEAGLSVDQRRQLLAETQNEGDVTATLRTEIENSLARQASRGQASQLKIDDVINSARALPPTLSGPELAGRAILTPSRQAVGETRAALSGESPRMAMLSTAAITAGPVDRDVTSRLSAVEGAASLETGQKVGVGVRRTADEPAAVSGEFPRMANPDGAAIPAGQIDSDMSRRLNVAASQGPADTERTAAPEIRQAVDEMAAAKLQAVEQTDTADPGNNRRIETADHTPQSSPAAAQRVPIPATEVPRSTEAPAANDREPVLPLNAQDQAGVTAATLGRLQQQLTEATPPVALAAALRQPATTEGTVEAPPPPFRPEGRDKGTGFGKDAPVSGAEVKAAALVGGGDEARSKPVHEVGGPVGGEGGDGVATALRRGRTEDANEAGGPDRPGAAFRKKQSPVDDNEPAAVETASQAAIQPGETVISMQSYYQPGEKPEAVPELRGNEPPADQVEVEMDAAMARAEQRTMAQVSNSVPNVSAPADIATTAAAPAARAGSTPPVAALFTGEPPADPVNIEAETGVSESTPPTKQQREESQKKQPAGRSATGPADPLASQEKPQTREARPPDTHRGKEPKK